GSRMVRWRSIMLLMAVLPGLGGCGTVYNLWLPPPPPDENRGSINECTPMAGSVRSGLLASIHIGGGVFGTASAPGEGNAENFLEAGYHTGLGLGALVDTPISFAGDIVTLPIVFARRAEHPWAMWWGPTAGSTPDRRWWFLLDSLLGVSKPDV